MDKYPGRTRSYWGHVLRPNKEYKERGKPVGQVVRDYIPEPKNASVAEKDKFERARLSARGATARDFIPGPDHTLKPPSGSREQADDALDRSLARQATAAREDFQAGVLKLAGLNVAQAIDSIRKAPASVQEMLLVAESLNGNRVSILQVFPDVDPATVQRWSDINAGSPDPATAPSTVSVGAASAPATDTKE